MRKPRDYPARHDGGTTTSGLTWTDRLDMAASISEVLDVVRVHAAQFTPTEIAALPARCRPRKVVDANDLAEYALDLVRETCAAGVPSADVAKLAAFVSHASARCSGILSASNEETGRSLA